MAAAAAAAANTVAAAAGDLAVAADPDMLVIQETAVLQ